MWGFALPNQEQKVKNIRGKLLRRQALREEALREAREHRAAVRYLRKLLKKARLAAAAARKKIKRTSSEGVAFIKRAEGFSPVPVNIGDGVITWGYGHTAEIGDPSIPESISEADAVKLLAKDLARDYEPAVRKLFAKGGPLAGLFTQARFDALVSFAYNLGAGAFTASSGFETIQRNIKARDVRGIAESFVLYRSPGTIFEEGLRARRLRERKLFLDGIYS
jgi:GH24 family phage-related lysozyme (muramidase)